MLTLRNVSKTFNPKTANEKKVLSGLNLHLDRGDFVTIIGSNGAGKSTVLNAIAGSFLIDAGRILLGKEDITFKKNYHRARDIGFLFQDPLKGTAPNMTIEENLSLVFMRSPLCTSRIGITAKDREFFKQKLSSLNLGLEDRLKSKVGLLSGGQRQALTLLMATLITPKVLLLDEHTAALDPGTAEKVQAITRSIVSENGITCLMVTHDISAALALGNRTIMMDEGKIILDLSQAQKENMTVPSLIERFKDKSKKQLNNDRMLLS